MRALALSSLLVALAIIAPPVGVLASFACMAWIRLTWNRKENP